jgi:iron complex outermembrane recepter protein
MKKRILTAALSLLGLLTVANAQQGNNITGSITGNDKKPLESATVRLLKSSDSSLVRNTIADTKGSYHFEKVKEGMYLISASASGHSTVYSSPILVVSGGTPVNQQNLELPVVARDLKTVQVVSKKPLIEQKLDRTIVNVDASITNTGLTALEVLQKSPGVLVDKDGNISLKGKQGVTIYIDGRPSYLSNADLASFLRNMSASQLEQIEIMTNPPAKYDAAGNSGIINIKTKKNKQFGYNGNITAGATQSYFMRNNESVSFNYRNNKINFFSNAGYSHYHGKEILYVTRNFRDSVTKTLLSSQDQRASIRNADDDYYAKAGLDYFVSRKTTLGVVFNGKINPEQWLSSTIAYNRDPNGNVTGITNSYSTSNGKWNNFSGNFNFDTKFDSAGRELSGNLDYIRYDRSSHQPLYSSYFDNQYRFIQQPDTLLGNLPQAITIYSAKADLTLPLKKGAKLEAGAKSSYVNTDNNAQYDTLRNNNLIHDYGRSNHFIYHENINAIYVNYSRPFSKKFNGQFGLRLENTISKGNQLTSQDNFKRNYTQLFPTAYLQYSLNEKNQFVLNYGRRIDRPNYRDLNPFVQFLDRYTFEQGNPDLKPQISQNIELSHTYNGFLTTTLNFSKTNNIIEQVIEQHNATHEAFLKKENIASQQQFGIAVSAYKEINKWWSGNIYANLSNNQFSGVVNNSFVHVNVNTLLAQLNQQFKWGKGWSAELSAFYSSRFLFGIQYLDPFGQVGLGLAKQVMKGKGTLKLNINDLFAGSIYKGYSKYDGVDVSFKDINYQRSIGISFTWRFNKGTLKANGGNKKGGASDEQNRVKTGN